jgi:hypothetical protein
MGTYIPAGIFCNIMVFMICNGICALPEMGRQVDFAQRLGQADPRRPGLLALFSNIIRVIRQVRKPSIWW